MDSGSISVFPNPANDYINIHIKNRKGILKIINEMGQIISVPLASKGNEMIRINTEKWSKGVYFLIVQGYDGVLSETKFIIN